MTATPIPNATKQCTKCDLVKPLSEFHREPAGRDGLKSYCKDCGNAFRRAWAQTPVGQTSIRRYNDRSHPRTYLSRYGLTFESFGAMVEDQDGRCPICLRDLQLGHSTHIDHDHNCCPSNRGSCGKCVRGLLCRSCNQAIGMLGEDPERLARAIDYITRWKART